MIRRARSEEAEEIARIVNAAFEVERDFRDGPRTSPAAIRDLLGREVFLVSEEAGRVLGAVEVRVAGASGYFGMLAVDPAERGGGHGRAPVLAAEDECRRAGCTVMTLSTGEDRTELFPYYEKLGYRIVGRRVSSDPAFKRPIVVVTMEKPLGRA